MIKKTFTFLTLTFLAMATISSSCNSAKSTGNNETSKWFNKKEWLNGVTIKPHSSINQEEFARQYKLDKSYWDKALIFLKTTDLENIKPGSYVIDEGNVFASVSEMPAKEKADIKWEAHKNFNDLQYIIKGKAKMGMHTSHEKDFKVTTPYTTKSDTENYDFAGGSFYDADASAFFIFTPEDAHRPGFKADDYSGPVKKLIIKVRVAK